MIELQRTAGNRAVTALARAAAPGGRLAGAVEQLAAAAERGPAAPGGPGRPLPDPVRGRMEAALGADFADVRLHESGAAPAMRAEAFAQGSDIHLAPGHGEPGAELLGHELAHVVQQRAGRVAPAGGALVVDPALEAEADAAGQRALAAPPAVPGRPAAGARSPAAPAARQPRLMSFAELQRRAKLATKEAAGLGDIAQAVLHEYAEYEKALTGNQLDAALLSLDFLAQRESDLVQLVEWSDDQAAEGLLADFGKSVEEERAYLTERMKPAAAKETAAVARAPGFPELDQFDEEGEKATAAKARFSAYMANCVDAGLPRQDVVGVALMVLDQAGGWSSSFGVDSMVGVFEKRLGERNQYATSQVLAACLTTKPDRRKLAQIRATMPEVEEEAEEEQSYEIDDEEEFLEEVSARCLGSELEVRKLWKTGSPAQRRTMYALMTPQSGLVRLSRVEYLVEAIDPRHRTISGALIQSWAKESSQWDIVSWMDSRGAGSRSSSAGGYTTEYMTPERRAQYELLMTPPAIYTMDAAPLVGDNIFVLSASGVFYGGAKKKDEEEEGLSVHHSSFMAGEAVKGAGHFHTDDAGVLWKIDERSGHYAPGADQVLEVLLALEAARMDLAEISVDVEGKLQNAREWVDAEDQSVHGVRRGGGGRGARDGDAHLTPLLSRHPCP